MVFKKLLMILGIAALVGGALFAVVTLRGGC